VALHPLATAVGQPGLVGLTLAALSTLVSVSLGAVSAEAAVVYCKTVGVPKGCVVRTGVPLAVVAAPRVRVATVGVARVGVGVGARGVGVRPGTAWNRGGPVNRIGRRRVGSSAGSRVRQGEPLPSSATVMQPRSSCCSRDQKSGLGQGIPQPPQCRRVIFDQQNRDCLRSTLIAQQSHQRVSRPPSRGRRILTGPARFTTAIFMGELSWEVSAAPSF
jgi:hypothetical protein